MAKLYQGTCVLRRKVRPLHRRQPTRRL